MNKEQALKACTVKGLIVKLTPEQLERKVYEEVAKSLNLIGGKWIGHKIQGFQFPSDPTDLLAQVANGEKRNLQKEFQFFPTPDAIADWLVSMAAPKKGELILEPSAGQGAIIKAIFRCCPAIKKVDCCELMPINQTFLAKIKGANPIGDDFLTLEHYHENVYDCIIANPPFSNNQDIDHIRQMFRFLKPGGRLVSIASVHWLYNNNKKETEFRKWLDYLKADIHTIEAGTFKEAGTMVGAKIISLTKPTVGAILRDRPTAPAQKPKPKSFTQSEIATIRHKGRKEWIIADMEAMINKVLATGNFPEYINRFGTLSPQKLAEKTAEYVEMLDTGGVRKTKKQMIEFKYGNAIYQVGDISMLPILLFRIKKDWGNGESPCKPCKPRNPDDIDRLNTLNEEIHQNALKTGVLPMPVITNETKQPAKRKVKVKADVKTDVKAGVKAGLKPDSPLPTVPTVPKVQPCHCDPSNGEATHSDLKLVHYSPKCLALFGNTKPIKDTLRNFGGVFNPHLQYNSRRMGGWIFPAKRENELRQYLV